MGMFDSIKLDAKCPYCGKESEIEFQTKDTDCELEVWRKGDNIKDKVWDKKNYLDTIADCHSKECTEFVDKKNGYHSGFGRMFNAKVLLNDGIITGEYEITDLLDS